MPKGVRLGGRQKGTPNKITPEIKELAQRIFNKRYWERVAQQAIAGELNPKIEALLLTYAYGAPKVLDHSGEPRGVVVQIGFLGQAPIQSARELPSGSTPELTLPAQVLVDRGEDAG